MPKKIPVLPLHCGATAETKERWKMFYLFLLHAMLCNITQQLINKKTTWHTEQ